MELLKRKEVTISKESFSFIHLEGDNKDKNIFFFHATGFNAETYKPFFLKLHSYWIANIQFLLYQRGHGLSKASAIPSKLTSWKTILRMEKFLDTFISSENILMAIQWEG